MSRIPALSLVVLTTLSSASLPAAAQPTDDPDDPWGYTAPEPANPPPTSELPETKIVKTKFQWSLNVGVPLWLNVPNDVVRPGADLSWVGGVDIGYMVFGFGVGVMWTPINLRNFTDDNGESSGQSPLTRLYFFPEVRVQVPNKSLVLPYVSGAFDATWWHLHETGLTCDDFFFCSNSSTFRFAPGFTGKVGLAFEIMRGVKVDVGMKYSLTGPGNFFTTQRWWLTPYVGVLVRRRVR